MLQRRSHLDDDQHHDVHDNVDHHLIEHDDDNAGAQYDDVKSASVDIHEHQHDGRTDFHDAAAEHNVHQHIDFDKHVDVNLDQHQYVDQYDHDHDHQHKHNHDDACTDDDHLQPAAVDLDNHHGCSDDHDESGTGNNFDQHLDEFNVVHQHHIVVQHVHDDHSATNNHDIVAANTVYVDHKRSINHNNQWSGNLQHVHEYNVVHHFHLVQYDQHEHDDVGPRHDHVGTAASGHQHNHDSGDNNVLQFHHICQSVIDDQQQHNEHQQHNDQQYQHDHEHQHDSTTDQHDSRRFDGY